MPQSVIDAHQRNNLFQTLVLLLAMGAVMSLAGFLLFGLAGVVIALGLLVFLPLISGRVSSQMLLRAYKAQPVSRANAPGLVDLMQEICQSSNLSCPPLFYIPSSMPNAFAAGTGKQSFVAVTDGLLRLLNRRELAGVLAHEVAHIINHDIRVLGMADAITRTTSMLSRFGLLLMLVSFSGSLFSAGFLQFAFAGLVLFFAPMVLVLLQLAISRTREFDADLGAAELTGDPMGLAMALQKISPPERPSLLDRLMNPGPKRSQPAMLRTHPPTEERVQRLVELAKLKQEQERTDRPDRVQSPAIKVVLPPVRRQARYHPTNGLWY